MDIREALVYVKGKHRALVDTDTKILGVACLPDNVFAEFYIVEVSLNKEDKEYGIDCFNVYLEGGYIPERGYGVGDLFSDNDIDALLNKLPPFVRELRYYSHNSMGCSFGCVDSAQVLKEIFPQLPSPYSFELSEFREKAIVLIARFNETKD